MYSYGQRKGGTGVAVRTQAARLFPPASRWGKANVELGWVLAYVLDDGEASGLDARCRYFKFVSTYKRTDLYAPDELVPVRMNGGGSHSCILPLLFPTPIGQWACIEVVAVYEPSHGFDQYGLPCLGLEVVELSGNRIACRRSGT